MDRVGTRKDPVRLPQGEQSASRLRFEGAALTEVHRSQVEAPVKEQQTEGGNRIMFQAVQKVSLEVEAVDLEFYPAKGPRMVEASPGHRVACYLYPTGIHGESA